MQNYSAQSEAAGRHIMPDLVRAFALIGIVLVNVGFIGHNMTTSYGEVGLNSGADKAAYFLVTSFFMMKSYTLFSFMFGAGLGYQMQSAQRSGASLAPRYFRRMFGLLALGLAHVYFAFVGDILIVYAVLGTLLFAFAQMKARGLWITGIIIYAVGGVIAILFGLLLAFLETIDPGALAQMDTEYAPMILADRAAYTSPNFFVAAAHRISTYVTDIFAFSLIQGAFAFSMFLIGLACVKQGLISDPSAPFWGKCRKWGLIIGLPLSLWSGYIAVSDGAFILNLFLSMIISLIAAPFLTFGYLGLIAKWAAGPLTPFKTFVARGGTASLTAYLLQSLILSFIFCGYGLGYYEKLGAAPTILVALAVGIVTIGFSSLWRKYFTLGPFEFLLRRWTYLGRR